MTNDVYTGGAVVGGIVTLLWAVNKYLLAPIVANRKSIPESEPAHDHRAGFQDSAYWDRRFDKLDRAIETVDRIHREHRQLSQGEIKDLRDLLVEIVANLKVNLALSAERNRSGD